MEDQVIREAQVVQVVKVVMESQVVQAVLVVRDQVVRDRITKEMVDRAVRAMEDRIRT